MRRHGDIVSYLKEPIYDWISWRDRTDAAVWVPAASDIWRQTFARELQDSFEGTQFFFARLGLQREVYSTHTHVHEWN
jgi:hypothetical protein